MIEIKQDNGIYVGIDTSNYTTSLAVCNDAGRVLANWKMPLPVKQGERGLRQSDAVFAHVKHLPQLMKQLQELLHPTDADAPVLRGVGYSATPRPDKDSYMPCFLAGVVAAQTLSAATNAPMYAFSHQEGHIMAALYSAKATDLITKTASEPFVAFHVSGGTTDVVLVHPREERFDIEPLGTSEDLHAGQAIDRIGVHMGLAFPCGAEMERLAACCEAKIPSPRVCVEGFCCHLSGLENLAVNLYDKTKDAALTSAYTLDFIGQTLSLMCAEIRRRFPTAPIVFSGGVMSNRRIQGQIAKQYQALFSEPQFSADNAAGIALLCRRAIKK